MGGGFGGGMNPNGGGAAGAMRGSNTQYHHAILTYIL
jgi:hypothetical protein